MATGILYQFYDQVYTRRNSTILDDFLITSPANVDEYFIYETIGLVFYKDDDKYRATHICNTLL